MTNQGPRPGVKDEKILKPAPGPAEKDVEVSSLGQRILDYSSMLRH